LLSNLISNAFASVQGMGRKSARAVRKMFEKADAPPEAAPASVEPTMREGTAALEDVASDPQVVSFVEDFRRRFEAALARAQNPAAPPPEGGEGPPPVAPTASPNP
jgi:hypothetical protein